MPDPIQTVTPDATASSTPTPQPDATSGTPVQNATSNGSSTTSTSTATPATSTPAQPQTQPAADPHPTSQYSHLSPDGQYGWNGSKWVDISGGGSVSNAPAPVHPLVAKAGILRQVATALAGGDRYTTTIDPQTGATTRTPVPLSGKQIGIALALEALSGAAAGFGVAPGPGVVGRAGAAGFGAGENIVQKQQQAQQQQAEADAKAQTAALAGRAATFEANSRAILNTAQSERYGVESLKDAVTGNAGLLSGYQDASAVQESHVSQDTITAGMKSGAYDPTKVVAIPDGFTSLNGRYEQTFSIVANPRAKVPLTSEQAQAFGDAGVQGWSAYKGGKNKVPAGYEVPGTMIATANTQMQAIGLMKQDVSHVTDALSHSTDKGNQELAKSIPNIQTLLSDPNNGPTLQASLMKLQKYVSHQFMHGQDLYESLQQMASPSKPNPQNPKQAIPNTDSPFANNIAGAIGGGDPTKGWAILRAYHDEVAATTPIKSVADAEGIVTNPDSTPKEMTQAHKFLALDRQQKAGTAGAEASARNGAEGSGNGALNVSSLSPTEYGAIIDGIGKNQLDASQMLRYGKADQLKILADVKAKYPNFDATTYQANLGLAKWATSGKGGDQIQALNTLHAHAQDFTDNATQLSNLDASFLNTPINKLKNMTGNPNVTSTVGRMLAVRTEYMNVLNNNHALSVEDKADADKLLNENQSPAQWQSAIQQITDTADLRGAQTNARYKATFGRDMPNYRPSQGASTGSANVVPPGATPGRDASGKVIGYRTANGQVVRF